MSAHTTPELPIDEHISRAIDWDIRTRPPVSTQIADDILTVLDLNMHFSVTKGLLKRRIGAV